MKDGKDILGSVLKTTQMGQTGIRAILDTPMRPALRKALESQLREYDAIEDEAHSIAFRRGWEPEELDPAAKKMARAMAKARLHSGSTDSKIAEMMIRGNTRGMIKGLKNIHQFNQRDIPLSTLSQRLLDCETANIRQMQSFL